MGQYYKAIILGEQKQTGVEEILGWLTSYDYDNGAKLMEHSWIGNNFVQAVEDLVSDKGPFYKSRLVWSGDYADNEEGSDENLFSMCSKLEYDEENKDNSGKIVIKPSNTTYRYVLNHSKKLYVDKDNIPGGSDGWKINPLPLLTCEGNGRGGGDYHPDDLPIIGSWARNKISVSNTEPPSDFKEINFDLTE